MLLFLLIAEGVHRFQAGSPPRGVEPKQEGNSHPKTNGEGY